MNNEETLRSNIRAKIRELKKNKVTGMSRQNLKQIVSTKGLTCSVSAYHQMFASIVNESEFNNFLYGTL